MARAFGAMPTEEWQLSAEWRVKAAVEGSLGALLLVFGDIAL